jgi:hypothetical protein
VPGLAPVPRNASKYMQIAYEKPWLILGVFDMGLDPNLRSFVTTQKFDQNQHHHYHPLSSIYVLLESFV